MGKTVVSIIVVLFLTSDLVKGDLLSDHYVDIVEEYANNVIKYGKDLYGDTHSPLLAYGINLETKEPVKWKRDGQMWILSNLASQQNLFRTFVGLTNLTKKTQYRRISENAVKYAFENLQDPNGLLHWGGHIAYDLQNDTIVKEFYLHELKSHYPYYELMWEIDPEATKQFLEAFWLNHVLDWSNLDLNRHGDFKNASDKSWEQQYNGGDIFFWGKGLTFINAGSDLFYAGAMLSKLSGEQAPLVWAKRLAHRYVETRDSDTGISGYQYSQSHGSWCLWEGRKPLIQGDRVQYQFSEFFKDKQLYEGMLFQTPEVRPRIVQIYLGEILGEDGKEFTNWAIEELIAWGKHAYRPQDNSFTPMFIDGTSLEGFVIQKEGYFGPKGRILKAVEVNGMHFWTYSLGYSVSENKFLWQIARHMGNGLNYGDIGSADKVNQELNLETKSSDPCAALAFLELYKKMRKKPYLEMAVKIADNIIEDRFIDGLFVENKKHNYTRFSRVEPLVLLHLAAAIENRQSLVPRFYPGLSYFDAVYDGAGRTTDDKIIYAH